MELKQCSWQRAKKTTKKIWEENCEGNLRPKESSGRSPPKTDVQEILQGEDIVKTTKTQRLRWYGHTRRIGEKKVVKKVREWWSDLRRARERPKSLWEEQVLEQSTIGGERSRIGSHGRQSQKRQRRACHWNRNEGKCEVTHHKLRAVTPPGMRSHQ